MAGDNIVLLGKFFLRRLIGIFYAGKNLHYLNWMMVGLVSNHMLFSLDG